MATLSGNKIKDTYQSLIKLTDNGNLTTGAKQLTDGFGNNSPLYISTTQIGIGVTPEATYDLHVYSNAKVGGNLTVTGDLTVEGTTTTIDTQTLTVEDPLIEVASNNTSTDAVDIGWYGKYAPSGTVLYAGLFRDTGDSKFKLFRNLEEQPTTTVNTSGTGYTVATLVADVEGTLTGIIASSTTATTQSAGDNSTKVATTAYVDTEVGNYLPLAGGTMSGSIAMGGNNISGGGTATFTSFVGDLTGNADTATALETARTIQVSGDIAGSASFDGTADINISTTIQPNSVALGTDTTGNYVATISGTANEITVSGSGSESAAVTISLPSSISVDVTGDLTGDVYNADGSIILNTGDNSNDAVLSNGVRATTQSQGDNSTKLATTAYVDSAIGGQDTLSEVLANGNTTGGTDIAVSAGDDITFADDSQAIFGTNSDLKIYHDNTNAFVDNNTGSLYFTNYSDDKDIIFRTDDGSGGVVNYARIDGSSEEFLFLRKTRHNDNITADFGTGRDLQIYHDGSNSYIDEDGTGSLFIKSSFLKIRNNSNESMIDAISDGAVNLYYDNSKKFETTSTGVTITGGLSTTNSITLSNPTDKYIRFIDTYGNWQIEVGDGANNFKIHSQSLAADYLTLEGGGQLNLGEYGSGSFTGTAAYNLSVDSSGNIIETAGGVIDGSGTATFLPRWIDSNTLGDSILNQSSNDIIIGYNSNSTHSFEKTFATGHATGNRGAEVHFGMDDGGGNVGMRVIDSASSNASFNAQHIEFHTHEGGVSVGKRMEILSTGNSIFYNSVGIGTSSPSTKLETVGIIKSSGNGASFMFEDRVNSGNNWEWFSAYNKAGLYKNHNTAETVMTIDSSGNVGIGTDAPDGIFKAVSGTSPNAAQILIGYNSTSENYFDANTQIFRNGSYAERMRITSAGQVGIGISTIARGPLHVHEGSTGYSQVHLTNSSSGSTSNDGLTLFTNGNDAGLMQRENSYLLFGTNDTERMRIDSSGNIGIGVTPESWGTNGDTRAIQISTMTSLSEAFDGTQLASNFYFNGTNDKYIQSDFATSYLQIDGTHRWRYAASGTADANITWSEAMRINSSGNVGIGTDSPSANLHISGSGDRSIAITSGTSGASTLNLGDSADIDAGAIIYDNSNNSMQFKTNAGERMRINSSGDISIADGDLEFSAATGNHTIYVADYTGDNYFNTDRGNIEIKASSSANSGNNAKSGGRVLITAGNSYNGQTGDIVLSTGKNYLNASDNGAIRFNIGGTVSGNEKMRIDSSGNVGIGTTSPSEKLHINSGTGNVPALFESTDNLSLITFKDNNTTTDVGIGADDNDEVFYAGGSERMRIDSSGNVGIGTTSPDAQLEIEGTAEKTYLHVDGIAGNAGIASTQGAMVKFYNNGDGHTVKIQNNNSSRTDATVFSVWTQTNSRFLIRNDGNVGIGETNPEAALHIKDTNAEIRVATAADGETAKISLTEDPDGDTHGGYMKYVGGGDTLRLGIYNSGTATDVLTIKDNFNVGIGTTSAGRKLTVTGDASGDANNLLISNENDTDGDSASIGFSMLSNNTYVKGGIMFERTLNAGRGNLYLMTNSATDGTNVSKSDARLTVQHDGNIGIGTTSPSAKLDIVQGSASPVALEINTENTFCDVLMNSFYSTSSTRLRVGTNDFQIHTNGSQNLTVTSGGYVGIGVTSPTYKFHVASSNNVSIFEDTSGSSGATFCLFNAPSVFAMGSITRNGSATSVLFNTSSDYRLKEDLQDFNALDLVDNITAYDYKWKDTEQRDYGFVAHELQEVMPNVVSGEKDGEEMQKVDYSKLTPVLLKAIQELKQEIETLKAQINN